MPDLNVHYVEMNKIMSKIHIKKLMVFLYLAGKKDYAV